MIHFLMPDGKVNILSIMKFMNYGIKEMDLAFEEKNAAGIQAREMTVYALHSLTNSITMYRY